MQDLMTKENIAMFLCIIIGLAVLSWFILPKTITIPLNDETNSYVPDVVTEGMDSVEQEGYATNQNQTAGNKMIDSQSALLAVPQGAAPVSAGQATALKEDQPFVNSNVGTLVDPKTGSLIDGPGFEKSERETPYSDRWSGVNSNFYFLDDGAGGELSIQHNLCSKSCCSEQWPTPFKQKHDPYVCGNKDQFVSSRIMCNNTFQDSGCLCLTKKQATALATRAGNGGEWW